MSLREKETTLASSIFQIASPRCTCLCNFAFVRPPNCVIRSFKTCHVLCFMCHKSDYDSDQLFNDVVMV